MQSGTSGLGRIETAIAGGALHQRGDIVRLRQSRLILHTQLDQSGKDVCRRNPGLGVEPILGAGLQSLEDQPVQGAIDLPEQAQAVRAVHGLLALRAVHQQAGVHLEQHLGVGVGSQVGVEGDACDLAASLTMGQRPGRKDQGDPLVEAGVGHGDHEPPAARGVGQAEVVLTLINGRPRDDLPALERVVAVVAGVGVDGGALGGPAQLERPQAVYIRHLLIGQGVPMAEAPSDQV